MQLAVVTDYEYRAHMVDQIVLERGWQSLACVGQPQPRDWLLQYQSLDLILVDLDVPNAIQLLKELTHYLPHVSLVALATPQRIVELQDAMLAGASNFVAFPLEPKQFIATMERARRSTPHMIHAPMLHSTAHAPERHHAPLQRRSKMIAVTSLKGGVGRSTVAANVAVALRQRTARDVIVVEAHQGLGHLSLLLNLYPRHTIESLENEANIDVDLVQGLLQSHGSGIRLLAAPTDPGQLVELPIETWQQVLTLLGTIADYIVVDTSSHVDGLLSEVLSLADDILVVTGSDIAGLRDARILLHSLRHENVVEGRIHVVLNRAGSQGGIDERLVQEQLKEPVAASIPEDCSLAAFAFNRGIPFVMSHPRSLLSRRLVSLVDRLVDNGTFPTPAVEAKRSSLFSFLNLTR
ncbi:MAG: P-loop NTPase [Caldilineaceae bacterium]